MVNSNSSCLQEHGRSGLDLDEGFKDLLFHPKWGNLLFIYLCIFLDFWWDLFLYGDHQVVARFLAISRWVFLTGSPNSTGGDVPVGGDEATRWRGR